MVFSNLSDRNDQTQSVSYSLMLRKEAELVVTVNVRYLGDCEK